MNDCVCKQSNWVGNCELPKSLNILANRDTYLHRLGYISSLALGYKEIKGATSSDKASTSRSNTFGIDHESADDTPFVDNNIIEDQHLSHRPLWDKSRLYAPGL